MAAGAKLLVPYGISKVGALGLAFVWNFTSRKFLLFAVKAEPKASDHGRQEGRKVPESYSEWVKTMAKATTARSKSSPDVDEGSEIMRRAASTIKSR
jgi:hypothetical protein